MSGKNRAFALAIATAALVGFCAPMASAATIQDGPSGFNNDSILNLSNNQVPVQACTGDVQTAAAAATQTITSLLGSIGSPTLSPGAVTPSQSSTCTQSPTQMNSTTTTTTATDDSSTDPSDNCGCTGKDSGWSHSSSNSDSGPSGFNNDSILNLSGNQVPVQACTGDVQTAAAAALQTLTAAGDILSPGLTTGALNPSQTSSCTQSPSQSNSSSVNS